MNRQFAIITLSVVPVRAQPSDAAEQISQLLFGESVEILAQETKWWKATALKGNINKNSELTTYSKKGDVIGKIFSFILVFILLFLQLIVLQLVFL